MTIVKVKKTPWIFRSERGHHAILDWYERNLEALPISWESQWVDTEAGKTHVLVMGNEDAPPIVILHGLSINALAIRRFLLPFAQSHRVYAPDILGQPGKSSSTRPEREGDGFPLWLVEVLNGLGLDKTPILGTSFGAWLGMKLATLAPERISHGIFFVPAGLAPVRLALRMHFLSNMPLYWARPTQKRLLKLVLPLCSPGATPEEALVELMGLSFRYVKQKAAPFQVFTREDLQGYNAPTLVMAGEKDLFYHAEKLIQHAGHVMPHAELEIVPRAGHLMFGRQMEEVYQRMLHFLQST